MVVKKKTEVKTVAKKKKPQDSNYWHGRPLDDSGRDWDYGKENWIVDYEASVDHPHRDKILKILHSFEWSYLLEVGCSAGPNLERIRREFSEKALFGVDINEDSVAFAKKKDFADVRVGDFRKLPFIDDYFDVVLADAVLMYATPSEIKETLKEIDRVTSKAILIVDRFAEKESITGHVYGRNYIEYLEELGYHVEVYPVTKEDWETSENWQKYGRYFLGIK